MQKKQTVLKRSVGYEIRVLFLLLMAFAAGTYLTLAVRWWAGGLLWVVGLFLLIRFLLRTAAVRLRPEGVRWRSFLIGRGVKYADVQRIQLDVVGSSPLDQCVLLTMRDHSQQRIPPPHGCSVNTLHNVVSRGWSAARVEPDEANDEAKLSLSPRTPQRRKPLNQPSRAWVARLTLSRRCARGSMPTAHTCRSTENALVAQYGPPDWVGLALRPQMYKAGLFQVRRKRAQREAAQKRWRSHCYRVLPATSLAQIIGPEGQALVNGQPIVASVGSRRGWRKAQRRSQMLNAFLITLIILMLLGIAGAIYYGTHGGFTRVKLPGGERRGGAERPSGYDLMR
ncbi:MAG: hypothetical protein K9N49_08885 [Candidatus Marinimicrobia bacterium]|nr:hypothetical protein [Candidatus Neomarinimicrobiota bacterium]